MYLDNRMLRKLSIVCLGLRGVAGYSAVPRWGQAVAIVNNALFVHGGKTDPSNSYSYTAAPVTNDLLYLPLSSPFDPSSPPWQLVGSSSNATTSQGPALAWHTLSAFNESTLLLFGGDPGPNSPTVLTGQADSAALLNVFDRANPVWNTEEQAWASEPTRRIHHTACSTGGKIWLIGGEKDDGSNNAFSDHYVFDPNVPSFTSLPSTNGPPDLYGHACVVLSDGRLIIFGGYSPSTATLIPFTTMWVIDTTQSTLTWTSLSISGSSLPSPRRGFASTLLEDGKLLIQGGADATLQNLYSDGWILDTTQNPMVWSSVSALSQVGARYDHFAVTDGSQVMFGFGYGTNAAAPAALQIYDTSSGSFISSFTPAPVPTTNTLPSPSQTQTPHNPSQTQTSTGTGTVGGSSPHGTGTATGSAGNSGTGTTSGAVHPTYTQGGGGGGNGSGSDSSDSSKSKTTTAIAVGTAFGVLALIAGGIATGYYLKHHRSYPTTSRFHLLGGEGSDDGGISPHLPGPIPVAGVQREKFRSGPGGWFSTINKDGNENNQTGVGHSLNNIGRERRDMFADEDTRDFGAGGVYSGNRDGSGGSSWSLRSVGVALGAVGTGVRGILSRENSDTRSLHRETSDPFADGASLMREGSFNPYGIAIVRPHARRETSYASTARSYHDPFVDNPIEESNSHESTSDDADANESTRLTRPEPSLITVPPTLGLHTLAPLAEQRSRSTDLTSSSSSNDPRLSPFESRPSSSATSYEYRPTRRSSIINSNPTPNAPIRRSDSWWMRFSKTSFLDRRNSDGGVKSPSNPIEIRDPNPAPKLVTIQEASAHSQSPGTPESQRAHARGDSTRRDLTDHRKSVSSLQTAMTADSDAIERMGGMDIIQRVGTSGSHQTTPSTGRDTPERDPTWTLHRPLSMVPSSERSEGSQSQPDYEPTVDSPSEMTQSDLARSKSVPAPGTPDRSNFAPQRPNSGGNVLERIHAYERQMSEEKEITSPGSPLSPTARNTRKKEEHPSKNRVTINYGFAPRPSLFVANPDHKGSPSSES